MFADLPPSPPAIVRSYVQEPQAAVQIPQTDIFVEVAAEMPLRTRIQDVTRLLGRRQMQRSSNRTYLPTIVELITLVERNPIKPVGREWLGITALTIGYDVSTQHVVMEYCIDNCAIEPGTGTPHPRRKMVSYRAPEKDVAKRLSKKLDSLQRYAERPTGR